ncbi:MAG: transposase [Terrimonas sp.]|nr:transposase [Terrimonas sp.]
MTGALKAYEASKDVQQICRELKINRATFYNWQKKYGGLDVTELKRLRQLEDENNI